MELFKLATYPKRRLRVLPPRQTDIPVPSTTASVSAPGATPSDTTSSATATSAPSSVTNTPSSVSQSPSSSQDISSPSSGSSSVSESQSQSVIISSSSSSIPRSSTSPTLASSSISSTSSTLPSSTPPSSTSSSPTSTSPISSTVATSSTVTTDSTSTFSLTSSPSSSQATSTSNVSLTTFTSLVTTEVNGTPTTIPTTVVTSLSSPPPSISTSQRTAIIAGSAVGGVVAFVLALAILWYLRRRIKKREYASLRHKPPSRSAFLAGEDMDDPVVPGQYRDDPFASHHSGSGDPPYELPPRLFRARASESGSIFQEAVWPPPGAGSRLRDPLTGPSSKVDLSGIVDGVMGPSSSPPRPSSGSDTPRIRGGASFDADESRDSLSLRLEGSGSDLGHGHDRDMSTGSQTGLIPRSRRASYTPSPLILTNPDVHGDGESPTTPTRPKIWKDDSPTSPRNWLERSPRDRSSGGGASIGVGHEGSTGAGLAM
ncbi:hypothetical protein EW146_g3983 [Bondarzewia mesenterica]|uniref:REJ domain-containing protein n=1 Tax=Bondarzewia mesenterica TaxID=1095465 RepID=A0A4S4LY52_9AGAM|nr:hypothetical protein EW146_g3983 [Bondarzewia mesenterica]